MLNMERPSPDAILHENNIAMALDRYTRLSWFEQNAPTDDNLATWGQQLIRHMDAEDDEMDKEKIQPLARYLHHVATMNWDYLIPTLRTRSPAYETFCAVMNKLSTDSVLDWNPFLETLNDVVADGAPHESLWHSLSIKLESTEEKQYDYDMYVLDNGGEYEESPAGLLMRGLMSLSFQGHWEIPPNEPVYHRMWEVLNSEDRTVPTELLEDPEHDMIVHLAQQLPHSVGDALEYYQFHGDHLTPKQQQTILGMNLSVLSPTEGVRAIVNAVYWNDHDEESAALGQRLFETLHPGASTFASYLALYDNDAVLHQALAELPAIQQLFTPEENTLQTVRRADALINSLAQEQTNSMS